MKLNNKNKGFTLIELLVVIAIIGILSGVVLNGLQSARSKARNAQRLSDVNQIRNAMELYATASGTNKLPQAKDGTGAVVNGWFCLGWDGTTLNPTTTGSGGSTGAYCPTTGSNAYLNTEASKYFAGGKIIKNAPYPPTDVRSYYRYNASFQPAAGAQTTAFTPLGGAGAYLMWLMEGATASCGPGKVLSTTLTFTPTQPAVTTCGLKIAEKQ